MKIVLVSSAESYKSQLKGGGPIFGPPPRFVVFGEKKPPLGAAEIKIFR